MGLAQGAEEGADVVRILRAMPALWLTGTLAQIRGHLSSGSC